MNAYEQYGQVTQKRADAQKANMGSTYDAVPQTVTSGLGSPLTFGPPDDDDKDDRTFDQKIYDGLKSFGAMFFGDPEPNREQTILDAYDNDPMLSVPDVSEKGVLDYDLLNAKIADAVDYSKATPIAYESGIPNDANMRYDEVPPPSANKNLAANSIKTAVKQTFPDSKFYEIKRGDTLGEIALENGVTVDDLVKVNALEDKTGDTIIAGNTLVIPESKDMERVKQYVLAADPERKFYQSGVPMDQRDFAPEGEPVVVPEYEGTPPENIQQTGADNYETADDMTELEILARTIQAEAGGESKKGKLAVGAVIKNRANQNRFGTDIRSVILYPTQFSPWNKYTNSAKGEQGKDMLGEKMKPSKDSYEAAQKILSGDYVDPTFGATHFVNPKISKPKWYKGFKEHGTTKIGKHEFGDADKPLFTGGSLRPKVRPKGLGAK